MKKRQKSERAPALAKARGLGAYPGMPSPRVTLCGSISLHPVSTGAAMHLAGYQTLGLAFTYVPFGVTNLAGAVDGMRALGIRGLGVSMPYKQQVIPLLDALDPLAARIGAVNTIVNDGGRLTGHNTDAAGAARALEEIRPLAAARVLLLGAGGAGRAVACAVRDRGASLTIANRNLEKARALAEMTGARATELSETARAGHYDIVINATSVGMSHRDPASPIPEDAIRAGQVIMDIVYNPLETELVRAARRRGAITVHGGRMLLHQAARQFELYTGAPAPLAAMEAALLEQLAKA